jgi:hypothetical protein
MPQVIWAEEDSTITDDKLSGKPEWEHFRRRWMSSTNPNLIYLFQEGGTV